LALALAEGAVRSGVGCTVDGIDGVAELFSESPSRAVLGTERPDEVLAAAEAAGIPARVIGAAGGDGVVVAGLLDLAVSDAADAWRRALPDALGEAVPA
jgi:phosphoribosylformylglycinamidine synthase